MVELGITHLVFGAVVIIVAIVGIVVALVFVMRRGDPFASEGGRFRIFHGDADTSPHPMPGARFEERHVIDPTAATDAPERPPVRH